MPGGPELAVLARIGYEPIGLDIATFQCDSMSKSVGGGGGGDNGESLAMMAESAAGEVQLFFDYTHAHTTSTLGVHRLRSIGGTPVAVRQRTNRICDSEPRLNL